MEDKYKACFEVLKQSQHDENHCVLGGYAFQKIHCNQLVSPSLSDDSTLLEFEGNDPAMFFEANRLIAIHKRNL
jgi:hypothetical protein